MIGNSVSARAVKLVYEIGCLHRRPVFNQFEEDTMKVAYRILLAASAFVVAQVASGDTNIAIHAVVVNGRIVVSEPAPAAKESANPAGFDTGLATLSQRGELFTRGQMTDSQGRLYNIQILPGYVAPWRYLKDGWSDAGGDLGEYFEKATWHELANNSSDAFKWGWKDSLWEFGIKDTGSAWTDRFAEARNRTAKRTFGWPFAYPWALFGSTVETVIRVPLGVVGAGLGTVWGGAVVPVAETVWPTVKGVWNGGVNGAVIPVAGWTWQTVAAPPAMLFASAPNPSRTDGLWMSIVPDEKVRQEGTEKNYTQTEAIKQLASYGRQLDTALAENIQTIEEIHKRQQAEQEELQKRFHQEYTRAITNETLVLQRWLEKPENESLVVRLAQDNWDRDAVMSSRAELQNELVKGGLNTNDAQRIVNRLISNPPASHARGDALDTKTDPLIESLRILDETGGPRIMK